MKQFLFWLIGILTFAQIPAYYSSVDFSQSASNVEIQLANLITSTHTNITSYDDAWSILQETDLDPANNNNVLLIYGYNDNDGIVNTDRSRDLFNNGGNVGQWNREHVYAKSLATPAMTNSGPGADPHMLRACDVSRNGMRNNFPFTYGSGVASYAVNGGWYPGEEWRGDVARIIMYMYLRYGSQCLPNNVAIGSSHSYDADMPDIFLTWNEQDPVSAVETQRNNYLQTELGNRNPFIDNPYLATLLWGGPAAENTWNLNLEDLQNNSIQLSLSPNPVHSMLQLSEKVQQAVVFNLEGRKIKTLENIQTIDVSTLANNIYLLEITTLEGEKLKMKFIKN